MTGTTSNQFALAIEASNPSATREGGAGGCMGVAIGRVRAAAGKTFELEGDIVVEALHNGGAHEDDLMPAIDRLARKMGASPGAIRLVAVSIGPGGFTALRVAVTIAKTLCLATGAQCVGVPTALVLASTAESVRVPFAVLLAGKGDSAFATLFDGAIPGKMPGELALPVGRLVTAADIVGLGVRAIIGDRFVPKAIVQEAEKLGIVVLPPLFDAKACLKVAIRMRQIAPELLAPLYPREPEAVTKWRALHPDR